MIVFSSIHHGITVSRNTGGSHSCSGHHNGTAIKQAIAIDGGNHCILLLDPDAIPHSAFENLLCIDRKGNSIWTARLPTNPDVFLEITPTSEGILAITWSGFNVLLDRHTGAELRRNFVK